MISITLVAFPSCRAGPVFIGGQIHSYDTVSTNFTSTQLRSPFQIARPSSVAIFRLIGHNNKGVGKERPGTQDRRAEARRACRFSF